MNTFFSIIVIFLIGGVLTFASQSGNEKKEVELKVDMPRGGVYLKKLKIDGTTCVIATYFQQNVALSCDWSK